MQTPQVLSQRPSKAFVPQSLIKERHSVFGPMSKQGVGVGGGVIYAA